MKNVNDTQVVIFDLSEVLIAGLLGIEHSLAEHLVIPIDTILPAFGGELLQELCCGKITEDIYLQQIISDMRWNTDVDFLKEMIRRNFHNHVPGMQIILRQLMSAYDVILLSDHAVEWIEYIRTIHTFLANFKHLFFSFDLGQTKRKATTFTKVLQTMQVHPLQCLFIDDSKRNVSIARSVNIPSIHFVEASQLREELYQSGLLETR